MGRQDSLQSGGLEERLIKIYCQMMGRIVGNQVKRVNASILIDCNQTSKFEYPT